MKSKRFIEEVIPRQAWRKLGPSLKLTWMYLWMNCDEAGVVEVDEELFEFENGFELDLELLKEQLGEYLDFAGGDKILIRDFIRVNYGVLKENYNPHKSVHRSLETHQVKLGPSFNQACFKLVEEDKDKDEEEDEDKEEDEEEKRSKASLKNTPEASGYLEVVDEARAAELSKLPRFLAQAKDKYDEVAQRYGRRYNSFTSEDNAYLHKIERFIEEQDPDATLESKIAVFEQMIDHEKLWKSPYNCPRHVYRYKNGWANQARAHSVPSAESLVARARSKIEAAKGPLAASG